MTEKIRILVLVGGSHHDDPDMRKTLATFLNQPSENDAVLTESMEDLTAENLAGYDVVINTTTDREPTDQQHYALINAVAKGKGFIAVHGGMATFWNSPAYFAMTGGKFVGKSPEGRKEGFTVSIGSAPEVADHPITRHVEDYEVQDELFVIEGDQTQWQVLARSEGHPAMYTKSFGQGRVFVCTLGHDNGELRRETFQKVMLNAVAWVAGRL